MTLVRRSNKAMPPYLSTASAARPRPAPRSGYRVQFDLGDDGVVFWDGTQTPAMIDNEARDADTVMSLSLANREALAAGALNPTMA
jgi:putative sterol carrier protein